MCNRAMLHDKTEYPEPFPLSPECLILKDGQKEPRDPRRLRLAPGDGVENNVLTAQPQPPHSSICPGKNLAEDSVSGIMKIHYRPHAYLPLDYITVITFLANLNVQKQGQQDHPIRAVLQGADQVFLSAVFTLKPC